MKLLVVAVSAVLLAGALFIAEAASEAAADTHAQGHPASHAGPG